MTKEELITIIEENQKKIYSLSAQIAEIETTSKFLINEFIAENSKYKVGEVVNITHERYKTPRKYIIRRVWGGIHQKNDGTNEVYIQYNLETEGGYKPNGGWSVSESNFKLAK